MSALLPSRPQRKPRPHGQFPAVMQAANNSQPCQMHSTMCPPPPPTPTPRPQSSSPVTAFTLREATSCAARLPRCERRNGPVIEPRRSC